MISKELAYVALVVRDVEGAATVFEREFGLKRTDCAVGESGGTAPVLSVGASALALFAPDDPYVEGNSGPGVHHFALAVEDLSVGIAYARESGVPLEREAPEPGLQGGPRVMISAAATGGTRTYLTEPLLLERGEGGIVQRIDHIGVASRTIDTDLDTYVTRLGLPLESTQTDMETHFAVESFTSDRYGVVQKSREPEIMGSMRVIFVTVGDTELEIIQGFAKSRDVHVEQGRAGNTRQDFNAIVGYVARQGPGLHHIALKVADINARLAELGKAGLSLIDSVGRPGSRRALIGFVHPKSLYGVLLHLVERPDSWSEEDHDASGGEGLPER
jgi:methylmalonyl-CoA/ethylmalonyl-CoA epimerase